jgi:restriction endonuclease S subunit
LRFSLKNIASVCTGVYAQPEKMGEVRYVQAKHFNEAGQMITGIFGSIKRDTYTEKHLLQPGEILVAAKGPKNFAALYEEKNGPSIASTTFLIISILPEYRSKLLPEFLTWYINQNTTQEWVKAQAKGTAISSVSKSALSEMEVPVPPIEMQEAILRITVLRDEELRIQTEIESLREQLIQRQISQVLQ